MGKVIIALITVTALMYVQCLAKEKWKTLNKKKIQKRDAYEEVFYKRQTMCDDTQYRCSDYQCIDANFVCDMKTDCRNGKDEQNCPTDCTGPHQFKCNDDGSTECISHRYRCDGTPDCHDWKDEANCAEFDCLEGYTHCVTDQSCIRESYRCDGDVDCDDGSDEAGCPVNPASCNSDQFKCKTGSRNCISKSFVCDGDFDCNDNSDEEGCSCPSGEYKCTSGYCIDNSWKCDGDNDCGDNSDELGCAPLPAHMCRDILTGVDCFHMNQTAHPICTIYADGHKFCRKFCNLCQKS